MIKKYKIEYHLFKDILDFIEEVFTDSESKEEALIVRNLVNEIRSKKYYLPELELIMVNEFDEIIGYCMFSRFHLDGKYDDELLVKYKTTNNFYNLGGKQIWENKFLYCYKSI